MPRDPDRGVRLAPLESTDVIAAAAIAPSAAAAPSFDRAKFEQRLDMLTDYRRGDLDSEDDDP